MRHLIFFALTASVLCACSEPIKTATYDSGYKDGYAAIFNQGCGIRSTFISGHWDSAEYSRGAFDGGMQAATDISNNLCNQFD